MTESSRQTDAVLEVVSPDNTRERVAITQSPFLIGRAEGENHLRLSDGRISRHCAAIVIDDSGYRLEDRGNRYGLFVNSAKVERQTLRDGDVITFGIDGGDEIVFHLASLPAPTPEASVENLLTRIGSISDFTGSAMSGGLSKLNLLLEATSLLHSQLPLDSVLGTMLDHAISITHADRGLLMESDNAGTMRVRLAAATRAIACRLRL